MRYFSILIIALFLTACGDNDNDYLTIEEYLAANPDIETEMTGSGLHYIIHDRGDNATPNLGSTINIDYTGYFLDDDTFDSGNDVTFPLGNLIEGWQEGIRLIGKGGSITLIIPFELAYGRQGSGSIPGSTDIGFDITLHDFN